MTLEAVELLSAFTGLRVSAIALEISRTTLRRARLLGVPGSALSVPGSALSRVCAGAGVSTGTGAVGAISGW
jgi:hypothetical protein